MSVEAVGLSNLILQVKESLAGTFTQPVWVVAEISDMSINRSGHCYLELIEKDALSEKISAKSRATIWAFAFRMIKPYFETTSGETLRTGLKVLLQVNVEFHEVFGFSLNVVDIDPQYTIGDMARQRALVINKLKDEGVFDMNKLLDFPLVPQRIAVISSETAAGLEDFMNQLNDNSYHYRFTIQLFPAVMQGVKASESVIMALDRIFEHPDSFDVVAILRGGGSKTDLSCFDEYNLAYYITQFPLPVLTGIGHERDDSVADMVAHTRLKTPTAIAGFLIEKVREFHQQLQTLQDQIYQGVTDIIDRQSDWLERLSGQLIETTRNHLDDKNEFLIRARQQLTYGSRNRIHADFQKLENYHQTTRLVTRIALVKEQQTNETRSSRLKKAVGHLQGVLEKEIHSFETQLGLVDPKNVFKRGYSMVTANGKLIKSASQLQKGDEVHVTLSEGSFDGIVSQIYP